MRGGLIKYYFHNVWGVFVNLHKWWLVTYHIGRYKRYTLPVIMIYIIILCK
jgi:hypothetical protein